MDRRMWIRLEQWYRSLHQVQQGGVKIAMALVAFAIIAIVTHEPSERKRPSRIILNCDHCGTDPERSISYNEYMDLKEQQQQAWFREERQRIQQEIWDERGRQRWCRNHPQDRNCKGN